PRARSRTPGWPGAAPGAGACGCRRRPRTRAAGSRSLGAPTPPYRGPEPAAARRRRPRARARRRWALGLAPVESGHDLPAEEPEALQHLGLRDRLRGVDEEVHAVHADRFPALQRSRDALRVAEAEPLARLLRSVGPSRLAAELWQEPERRVRLGRIRFAHRDELRGEIVEGVRHPPSGPET